jgi:hypothetical protein
MTGTNRTLHLRDTSTFQKLKCHAQVSRSQARESFKFGLKHPQNPLFRGRLGLERRKAHSVALQLCIGNRSVALKCHAPIVIPADNDAVALQSAADHGLACHIPPHPLASFHFPGATKVLRLYAAVASDCLAARADAWRCDKCVTDMNRDNIDRQRTKALHVGAPVAGRAGRISHLTRGQTFGAVSPCRVLTEQERQQVIEQLKRSGSLREKTGRIGMITNDAYGSPRARHRACSQYGGRFGDRSCIRSAHRSRLPNGLRTGLEEYVRRPR